MTESPNAEDVPTTEKDTEPFGDETDTVPARKTSRQDSVGVGWEKPPPNEHIDGICEYFLVSITTMPTRGIMLPFDSRLCYIY